MYMYSLKQFQNFEIFNCVHELLIHTDREILLVVYFKVTSRFFYCQIQYNMSLRNWTKIECDVGLTPKYTIVSPFFASLTSIHLLTI